MTPIPTRFIKDGRNLELRLVQVHGESFKTLMTEATALRGQVFRKISTVMRAVVLPLLGLCGLLTPTVSAESTKTVFNPFTGKLDYITVLSSNTLPSGATYYIQNTSSLQAGATFYVSSGTANVLCFGDGTCFVSASSSTPNGPNYSVQISSNGIFSGSNNIVWVDSSTQLLFASTTTIQSGNGSGSPGNGLVLQAGSSTGGIFTGGPITLIGGTSSGTARGGDITLISGLGGTTNNNNNFGGFINIITSGTVGGGNGGQINIITGNGAQHASQVHGGNLAVTLGSGGGGITNGTGGSMTFKSGGGSSVATTGNGGSIAFTAGNGVGATGGNGGTLSFNSGAATVSGSGGTFNVDSGNGAGNGDAGLFNFTGGQATGSGNGANMSFLSGAANTGNGGNITLTAATSTSGINGNITLATGGGLNNWGLVVNGTSGNTNFIGAVSVSTMTISSATVNTLQFAGAAAIPPDSQALCLLGGQMGHCTSVVGVTGGCTCSVP